jgi:hypothetical protein
MQILAPEDDIITHKAIIPAFFTQYGEMFSGISHNSRIEYSFSLGLRFDKDNNVRILFPVPLQCAGSSHFSSQLIWTAQGRSETCKGLFDI